MDIRELTIEAREGTGKGPARRLRRAGRVPAILYGGAAPVNVSIDPRDVYRTWLPAGRRFTATLTSSSDGDLALYAGTAPSVVGRFATTGRLAVASSRGTTERLVYANGKQGRWAYIVVRLPSGTLDATYRLQVANAAVKKR